MKRALVLLIAIALVAVPVGTVGASSHVEVATGFPAASGPEGIAVDSAGNVFVSLSNLGEIWKVTPVGGKSLFYTFDNPGTFGLAVDSSDKLYVAHNSAGPDRGVWRISQDGARAKQLRGSNAIIFPNAITFDDAGYMYVTESVTLDFFMGGVMEGSVWRFPPTGSRSAELWYRDTTYLGGLGLFGAIVPGFPPIGANGVAYSAGSLFVANSERGTIVEIPIEADGTAGTPSTPVTRIRGLDGIAFDADGMIWAVRVSNGKGTNPGQLLRIDPATDSYKVIANNGHGLFNPASLAFGTVAPYEQSVYFTNFALFFPGEDALLRAYVGVEGQ